MFTRKLNVPSLTVPRFIEQCARPKFTGGSLCETGCLSLVHY